MDELGIVKLTALVLTLKPQGQTKVKGPSISYVVLVGGMDDMLLRPYLIKKTTRGVKNCLF